MVKRFALKPHPLTHGFSWVNISWFAFQPRKPRKYYPPLIYTRYTVAPLDQDPAAREKPPVQSYFNSGHTYYACDHSGFTDFFLLPFILPHLSPLSALFSLSLPLNYNTSAVASCVQWNLRITDKLVHRLMSDIRRLSFIGGFLPKILYFTFLSTAHPLFYIFMTY